MNIEKNDTTTQDPNTVVLDFPLKRGELVIDRITLRRPAAGELRGTTLNALANLEYDAMQKVLPRIATPMLTEADVARLDPADFVQLGGVFSGFLLPKAQKARMGIPTE